MNMQKANELRAAMGLKPISRSPEEEMRKRKKDAQRRANLAQRAQANRDMKAARAKRGK